MVNNMINKYSLLEKKINIIFKNRLLLENIFIHRSYLNEHKKFHLPSNEKLEFLGDSVLSLSTTIYLYQNYPQLNEGIYTDIKSAIVRTESLAEMARQLDLGDYLYLSKGEQLHDGRTNINILADCFEALVGGIFIDKGFNTAYRFITRFLFREKVSYIVKNKLYLSPKSHLQEIVQAKYKVLPNYVIQKENGPEHKKNFLIALYIKNKKISLGKGMSKKEAEEEAARQALKTYFML